MTGRDDQNLRTLDAALDRPLDHGQWAVIQETFERAGFVESPPPEIWRQAAAILRRNPAPAKEKAA